MKRDFFWDLFRDTGDPMCWLLARAEENLRREEKRASERRGDKPSAPG